MDGEYFNRHGFDIHGGKYINKLDYIPGPTWIEELGCYPEDKDKYQNEREIERVEISSQVIKDPVNKIVEIRTKQVTSRASTERTTATAAKTNTTTNTTTNMTLVNGDGTRYQILVKGDAVSSGAIKIGSVGKVYRAFKKTDTIYKDPRLFKVVNVFDGDTVLKINDVGNLYRFFKGTKASI